MVFPTVSFFLATCEPPFDVGLNHVVVHQRGEQVGEQNGQHNTFREGRVDHTDENSHHADQDAKHPATGIGHRSGYRVCRHEHHAEGEATHNQVPVSRNGKHRISLGPDNVQQQRHTDHADQHTTDNTVGGNLHGQEDQTTNQYGNGGRLTHGTLNVAHEGIHPADLGFQCFQSARGSPTQSRCATEAINCSPDSVAGNLRGIGKIQECTTSQGRVQEVLAGTTEHFLTDNHTEGDTQGHLPQRDGGRADQCEQYRGYKEAFVHFVTTHGGKQHFPETTHHKGDGIDRNEVGHTVDKVVPPAGTGAGHGQGGDKGFTQAAVGNHGIRVGCQKIVSLKTNVPHTEEHGRESTQPYSDHDAFEVYAVTHMGRGGSHFARGVENGINGFVQGIPALVLTTFFKMMLDSIEKLSDSHRISPRSRFGSGSRGESDRIHICRGTQRCTAPDLLHPAPGRQASVPLRYRQQSVLAAAESAGCPAASPAHRHRQAPWHAHCRWWWW